MKKNIKPKKLVLAKETVRGLEELKTAQGGFGTWTAPTHCVFIKCPLMHETGGGSGW